MRGIARSRKHGVSAAEIEHLFAGSVMVRPDVKHSREEERFQAIGRGRRGRFIFVVFTIRTRDGRRLIRPISARYMHQKEIDYYEKENPSL
jgi:uncharacterized DUF497 family protein